MLNIATKKILWPSRLEQYTQAKQTHTTKHTKPNNDKHTSILEKRNPTRQVEQFFFFLVWHTQSFPTSQIKQFFCVPIGIFIFCFLVDASQMFCIIWTTRGIIKCGAFCKSFVTASKQVLQSSSAETHLWLGSGVRTNVQK